MKPTPGPVLIEASAFLATVNGEVVAVFPYKEGDGNAETRAKTFSEKFVAGVAAVETLARTRDVVATWKEGRVTSGLSMVKISKLLGMEHK